MIWRSQHPASVSRDGRNWQFTCNRETFLRRGAPGAWDDAMAWDCTRLIRREDTLHMWYTGGRGLHATGCGTDIGLVTMPADRFVEMRI